MGEQAKVCPVITRMSGDRLEVLAFEHPSAGKQLVKGSIEAGESPALAAARELEEESGVQASDLVPVGETRIAGAPWYFFAAQVPVLEDVWEHQTIDDHGHRFRFFWHPLDQAPNKEWHRQFHEALAFIREAILR